MAAGQGITAIDLAADLARRFEGCRLTAYRDPVGIWTIGYGHTGPEVIDGLSIGDADAVGLLESDLGRAALWVARLLPLPLSASQSAALTDFVFNLGPARLRASTLRRKILRGEIEGAAGEFGKWVYAGGQRLPGLVLRRAAERALFLSG